MGERCIRIAKAGGSTPLCSTQNMGKDTLQNSLAHYIKDLDAYFYGPNFWQAGLYQQVKDLSFEQALWKPSPERHCIWENVRHVSSWKWFALEIMKGKKVESMKEHNWQSLPEVTNETSWKNEIERLKNDHEELKILVSNADESFLTPEKELSKYVREVIYHDCYHCGQIGVLRAMQRINPVT